MQSNLISTKLYKPSSQPNVVLRERLLEKLSSGLKSKLVIISAPAGFGKTTLLSEWISANGLPSAWLSLDQGDNDPKRFLTYCLAALQSVQPGFGGNTDAILSSPQQAPAETILTTFINEINSSLNETVLILDDYHLIESKAVHEAMTFLLEHMPLNIHLVISSRHDPPFPLAKLRVRKQLLEIREADLRFTIEEALTFFRETMKINIDEEDVHLLEDRTEGWIASLQLAALAMQGRKDINKFIKDFSGSHNYIVDYLTEEVLEHLDPGVQEFLLYTSILSRFNSQLCDAVTGGVESQYMLEYLDRAKLFLVPLDENKRWFRYHHLFTDLLKYRLEQLFPNVINSLHIRASKWFEANGFTEEAINHAIAANDLHRAAELIDDAAIPILLKGELITIQNLSSKVPESFLEDKGNILLALAWIFAIRGDLVNANPLTDKIEALVKKADTKYSYEQILEFKGHVALIRSYNFNPMIAGSYKTVFTQRELVLQAKQYLEKENPILQSTLNLILGWTYLWTGDWDEGIDTFEKAYSYAEKCGNHIVALSSVHNLIELMLIKGNLKKAYNFSLEVIQKYTEKYGDFFLPLGFVYSIFGQVLYQMNKLDDAELYLNKSLIIAEMMGNWNMFFESVYLLMMIEGIKKNQKYLKELLKKEEEILLKAPSYFKEVSIDVNKVRVWLYQNNMKKAADWIKKYNNDPMRESPFFMKAQIVAARIYVVNGEYFNALNLLEKIQEVLNNSCSNGWLIEVHILKSIIYEKENETDRALEELKTAIRLASNENYRRIFINEGRLMADLLTNLITIYGKNNSINSNFISGIIKEINSDNHAKSNLLEEPLSDREIEVLRLLASGYSNKAIADKLFVAIGTIKKHTHTIYQKMNVDSRTKAIQLAREINLI